MDITVAPNGHLQIDDAIIIHRNFEGRGDQFNREGDRNFSLLIRDEDVAATLANDGWNVKIKDPRDEGDIPFMFLPVKCKFNDRGPNVYLVSGRRTIRLNENTVKMLDDIDIERVDLDIRPYDWVMQKGTANEKTGRTAYLQAIKVVQKIDRFAAEFDDELPV